MIYGEFRSRARALGIKLNSIADEFGISSQGLYQWKASGVPRYAEYWLLWREEERKRLVDVELLCELRDILSVD